MRVSVESLGPGAWWLVFTALQGLVAATYKNTRTKPLEIGRRGGSVWTALETWIEVRELGFLVDANLFLLPAPNPKPQTPNPEHTLFLLPAPNPKPQTLNTKPQTLNTTHLVLAPSLVGPRLIRDHAAPRVIIWRPSVVAFTGLPGRWRLLHDGYPVQLGDAYLFSDLVAQKCQPPGG